MHTIQTYVPWVGFEPTIPAFEETKIVHALDLALTAAGPAPIYISLITSMCVFFVFEMKEF
jgi:hypothetical protein